MPKIDDFEITIGAELPNKTFTYAVDGTAVDFSASAHTFAVKVALVGSTTDLGLSWSASSSSSTGVVTVTFADNANDSLTAGRTYDVQIWPTETSSGKEREPAYCRMFAKAAIT